jgi:hypothetical protein
MRFDLEKYLAMNEAHRKAYKKVLIAIVALMDLDPDLDSPEGALLEDIAKACKRYEESVRLNND